MKVLNKMSKKSYYLQLSEAYEDLIKSGYFNHGEKLPTLNEIKDIFNVSVKVATQAYEVLSNKGYIYSIRGKGFFISHHEKMKIDLNQFIEIESKLINEKKMERHLGLFEVVKVEGYLAQHLALNDGTPCYHIKQFYGNNYENILLQDIYLPYDQFPDLENTYDEYETLMEMLTEGYNYKLTNFTNKYFSSQATFEHKMSLKLQENDPLWRVESTGFIDHKPLILINHYLSGEYVTMVVMLSVD